MHTSDPTRNIPKETMDSLRTLDNALSFYDIGALTRLNHIDVVINDSATHTFQQAQAAVDTLNEYLECNHDLITDGIHIHCTNVLEQWERDYDLQFTFYRWTEWSKN